MESEKVITSDRAQMLDIENRMNVIRLLSESVTLPLRYDPYSMSSCISSVVRHMYTLFFPDQSMAVNDKCELRDWYNGLLSAIEQELSEIIHQAVCGPESCVCREHTRQFINKLPYIREKLWMDVHVARDSDPAASSLEEIIIAYPGIYAIMIYRVAHELHNQGIPLIPRVLTEKAHRETGIDIHPGVKIGGGFFIDHGTGIVIGETAEIGDFVKIYQGVTLGAISVPKKDLHTKQKRHPTIEDRVTIYAGATILGGDTVIGEGSVIGGNVWLTKSVPPRSKVVNTPSVEFIHKAHGS